MQHWLAINKKLHKILTRNGFDDGTHYATFTRPNNHLIIEANSDVRDSILEVLKSVETELGVKVVENDSWSGGNRIGVIIKDWDKEELEEEVKDNMQLKESYIYLFPNEDAMGDYKKDCKGFNLTYLGKNKFEDEDNLVIKGSKKNLEAYADYLGYDLHPDYLYKEEDFAGNILKEAVNYVNNFYSEKCSEDYECSSERELESYVECWEPWNPTIEYWYDEEEGIGHITWENNSYTDITHEKEHSLGTEITVKELLDMWWNSVRVSGGKITDVAILYKDCHDGSYELDLDSNPYGEKILNMIVHTDYEYDEDADGFPIIRCEIEDAELEESIKEELSDNEIINILGIERDEDNPYWKNKDELITQYKKLSKKCPDCEIYLKGDEAYWKDKGTKSGELNDLVAVKMNESIKEELVPDNVTIEEFSNRLFNTIMQNDYEKLDIDLIDDIKDTPNEVDAKKGELRINYAGQRFKIKVEEMLEENLKEAVKKEYIVKCNDKEETFKDLLKAVDKYNEYYNKARKDKSIKSVELIDKTSNELLCAYDFKTENLKEDKHEKTVRDLFEKEKSYITEWPMTINNEKFKLFIEGLSNNGEGCDVLYEDFDINNINEVLVELIDDNGQYIDTLSDNITLDTTVSELEEIIKSTYVFEGYSTETDKENLKEDKSLAQIMGARLLPPKQKKSPRYCYEVYWYADEDWSGDPIYKQFWTRKAQEQWYEEHHNDADKFGMYALDGYNMNESINKDLKESLDDNKVIDLLSTYLDVEEEDISTSYNPNVFEVYNEEYLVFDNIEDAREAAISESEEIINELGLDSFTPSFKEQILENEDFIDIKNIDDMVYEDITSIYSDYTDEELKSELVHLDIVDEENVDAYDRYAMIDELVAYKLERTNSLEYLEDNYGRDFLVHYVQENDLLDARAIAEECVRIDGIAHFLATYDGEEIDLGEGYVAYRRN